MNRKDVTWTDATARARLVAAGEVSSEELVDAAIERIERLNSRINCVIYPRFDKARAEAAQASLLHDGIFHGEHPVEIGRRMANVSRWTSAAVRGSEPPGSSHRRGLSELGVRTSALRGVAK